MSQCSVERMQQQFVDNLREYLRVDGVSLIFASPGRDYSRDQFVWVVTVQLPDRKILTFHAPMDSAVDHFCDDTAASVAERILTYVNGSSHIHPQIDSVGGR